AGLLSGCPSGTATLQQSINLILTPMGFQPVAKWQAIPLLAGLPHCAGSDAGATVQMTPY
ncbi:MAG: hypothetical protein WBG50_00725, partial [Desulfomonilaceae bacterium]